MKTATWPPPHGSFSALTIREALDKTDGHYAQPCLVMPRPNTFREHHAQLLFVQLEVDHELWWVPEFAVQAASNPIPFTVGCYRVDLQHDATAQHFCCIAQDAASMNRW